MSESDHRLSIQQKALSMNLDSAIYGTIVEIGAGQEVARQFFAAGGAAGTIAKTMSAYDMKVSDDIYGKAGRYVSRERLEQMLGHEYDLLVERLAGERPDDTTFFTYAATVATKPYGRKAECHGWVGMRLQLSPGDAASEIVLHVRMMDDDSAQQSEALGMLGVNLIHGAFRHGGQVNWLIERLLDNVGKGRLEVDLVSFSGPAFEEVDHRLVNLQLIRGGLTRAVLFEYNGQVIAPVDALYNRPVQLMRGSFRPPCNVHLDMLHAVHSQFVESAGITDRDAYVMAELSVSEIVSSERFDDADVLARVDLLHELGLPVLVSDYVRFFRLRSWFRRYTQSPICFALSVLDFDTVFDERWYEGLEGGILEAIGKLFPDDTHVFVYPTRREGRFISLGEVSVPEPQHYLLKYLLENGKMVPVRDYVDENLHISVRELARQISLGRGPWENCVPGPVAERIRERKLFGYPGDQD